MQRNTADGLFTKPSNLFMDRKVTVVQALSMRLTKALQMPGNKMHPYIIFSFL